MKENEHRQVLMRELTKVGLKPTAEITNGMHLRIVWHYADGRRDFILTSKTPSDHRSTLNSRARIRQKLRQEGLYDRPLPNAAQFAKALELPDPDQMTLAERVNVLERDVDALLDMLVMRVGATAQPTVHKANSSRRHSEPGWVLRYIPAGQAMETKEIASAAGRNYYTTYSALQSAERKDEVERDGAKWRLKLPETASGKRTGADHGVAGCGKVRACAS